MENQIAEFITPRNEYELCELFEYFLGIKNEELEPLNRTRGNPFYLNPTSLALLSKTGIVSRIFRRWFQTNWGNQDWSKFFSGETPRQELSHRYPELLDGNIILSVKLEKYNQEWRTRPYLSIPKDTINDGGIFMSGLKNIKLQSLAPSFDLGFKKFTEDLVLIKNKMSPAWSRKFKNDEEGWWKIFWSQIGINLISTLKLELSTKNLLKIALETQDILNYFIQKQGGSLDDFIQIDDLFFYLWEILKKADHRLAPYEVMVDQNEETLDKNSKEKDFLYSTKIFYLLGHNFDEKILFPIDRYFGGIECVWTDHKNFLGALLNTTELLRNKLALPKNIANLSAQEKQELDYMGIKETAFDIERTCFAPPTVFRLLPSVKRYF